MTTRAPMVLKTWPTYQKVLPLPTVRTPSASNSPSALSAQAFGPVRFSCKDKIQSLFSLYCNLDLAILDLEHPDISPKTRSKFGFHPIRAVVLLLAAFHWLSPFADNDSKFNIGQPIRPEF